MDTAPTSTSSLRIEGRENAALYAYYGKAVARAGTFRRADFDPLDIPKLLPHLALARVERDPDGDLGFRWAVFGTYLTDQLGWDLTGKRISRDTIGDNADRLLPIYRMVVETARPILSVERLETDGRPAKRVEVLHLPMMSAAGDRVEQILVGWCVLDHRDRTDPLDGDKVTWVIDAVACDEEGPSGGA